ncbi:MAG: response regulator [Magnetococcus sp. YQC-5]
MSDPSTHDQNNRQSRLLHSGLGRMLLIWFLGLALIPLGVVSWRDHTMVSNALRTEAMQKLTSITILKSKTIEILMDQYQKDAKFLSLAQPNINFLNTLYAAWQTSHTTTETFVKSALWAKLVEEQAGDMVTFIENSHYNNLLLMKPTGEVLFTLHPDPLLGTNLLTGPFKHSRAGEAVKNAMAKKKTIFSDLERHETYKAIGYMVHPMIAENGEMAGVLLLQSQMNHLMELLEDHTGLGTTGETYLVGQDLLMRSYSRAKKNTSILQIKVDTPIVQEWATNIKDIEKHHKTQTQHYIKHQKKSYIDYNGHEVIGIYTDLHFMEEMDLFWVLIAEQDTEEFLLPLTLLRDQRLLAFVLISGFVLLAAWRVTRFIVTPLRHLTQWARQIQIGAFTMTSIQAPNNEIGSLVTAFGSMTKALINFHDENQHNLWLKQGAAELNERLRGEKELPQLANDIISFLATFLGAYAGAFYTSRSNKEGVILCGTFALPMETRAQNISFAPGTGLVGQCLLDKKPMRIHPVPAGYFRIQSGLGDGEPHHLLLFPFLLEDTVEAIVELGSFDPFTDWHMNFLQQESKSIAMAMAATHSRLLLRRTLEHSQAQALELQQNSEALRRSNEDLQAQSKALHASEALLQQQQEELRVSNEELEAHAQLLEEKNVADQRKNEALQAISQELAQKAADLEQASRYKSEFLSNMSHELRTPLNSMLILANSFAENEDGNLTLQQQEDALIIYNSGKDLLGLINEILDLAKIEAGRMDLHLETMTVQEFAQDLERNFRHIANKKNIAFAIEIPASGIPEILGTDREKAMRILKNLLANAFKFTSQGSVTLSFALPPKDWKTQTLVPGAPQGGIAISVSDTGIGIPQDKISTIFEAFRQVDGSISRQFGGTGLGLTISAQLAHLLGGEIRVTSEEGIGSVFTLLLPWLTSVTASPPPSMPPPSKVSAIPHVVTPMPAINDDRKSIQPGDRVMLIIEDDPTFARIVAQFAHEQDFKCLAAADGKTGLELARQYQPTGIILDIGLPVLDGWSVLDALKKNATTRHIPVHIMSASDMGQDGLTRGAASQYAKPVSKEHIREALSKTEQISTHHKGSVLLVDGDEASSANTISLLEGRDIQIRHVTTASEALRLLTNTRFDCLVMAWTLPDMDGFSFLDRLTASKTSNPPIVVYTCKTLTEVEYDRLKAHTDTILQPETHARESILLAVEKARGQGMVIKGAPSPEHLLDEVALFLHRVERDLPEKQRRLMQKLHNPENVFKNKTLLVVDDDVRNAYALTRQLERKEFKVLMAANGEKALTLLEEHPEIDCVLMDVMMPVMDGYEAMRRIRQHPRLNTLPVIALTAKAMEDDRRQCLACGANDYLAKPADMNKLLAMLKIWLYR